MADERVGAILMAADLASDLALAITDDPKLKVADQLIDLAIAVNRAYQAETGKPIDPAKLRFQRKAELKPPTR